MTLALTGHGVARGIAIGRCHIVVRNELEIVEYAIEVGQVEQEVQRLRDAILQARDQLSELAGRMDRNVHVPAGEVLQTHIMMLEDSSIRSNAEEQIRESLCNAEWALQNRLEQMLQEFNELDDDYIRTRGEDVAQVIRLVQSKLAEQDDHRHFSELPDRLADTLVIASDLTPGELANLHERGVGGIVTVHGGPQSHAAILAASLGIPAVLGVAGAQNLLREGETLILDGGKGLVYASPNATIRKHYEEVQAETRRFREALETIRDVPAVSADGVPVKLMANAQRLEDFARALECGAQGVGLYRTEFLFLEGELPGEEQQYEEYLSAVKALNGRTLTIRTLDLGADKMPGGHAPDEQMRNANPALGLRAIRLCLRDTDRFKLQLRAILRAAAAGPVRCLVPMVTTPPEIAKVRSLVEESKKELEEEGKPFDRALEIGAMIEVPAAALAITELAPHLDFISVGTNDLLQYVLAADRVDEQVAHLYDLQHPGVVRLLHQVLKEASTLNLPASVCGEAAGDRRFTRLLLAMGLRDFSMFPGRLLEVKQVILNTNVRKATAALTRWLNDAGRREGSLLDALDESQA